MGLAAQKGVREVCFLTIEMVMSCGRAAAGGKARFQHKFLGYPSDERTLSADGSLYFFQAPDSFVYCG